MKYFDLDDEEKQILRDFEDDKFKSIKTAKGKYQKYADFTMAKTRNINIRLPQKVLLKLKSKAAAEGLPYQTLAASIIHRHVIQK